MASEELLKPAAAAQRLDMSPSTLRVYSTRFAELLSEAAGNPPLSADGKPGHRLYSETDLVVLGKAKQLLAQGVTYDQALEELREEGYGGRPRNRGQTVPVAEAPTAPAALAPSVEALVKAVEGWQSLAEERARENALLRQRIASLEANHERELKDLMERLRRLEERPPEEPRRSGWLARLFGH